MESVAILSVDRIDIHNDSRILRQVKYLGNRYNVNLIAYGQKGRPINVPLNSLHIVGTLSTSRLQRVVKTIFYLTMGKFFPDFAYNVWYWQRPGHLEALNILNRLDVKVILANDWWNLPLAIRAAEQKNVKIVLDLHEYAFEEFADRFSWTFLYKPVVVYFLKKYVDKVDALVTVNSVIADRFAIDLGVKPLVVMNAPEIYPLLQNRLTDPDHIKLIHHGQAQKERNLEVMIDVMAYLPAKFSLTFMLFGNQNYINSLQLYARKRAPGRVHFIPPVLPSGIIPEISKFDIGIYILPPVGFNFFASLPNKFFEFIMAGLAVCIGPSPAMSSLVKQYGLGIVSKSFDPKDVADMINQLTPDQIDLMKNKSFEARKNLNADIEMGKLINLYRSLIEI